MLSRRRAAVFGAIAATLALATIVAKAAPSPALGYHTRAQALAGARLYAVSCSRCHGANLGGAGAPPLAGAAIRGRWPVSTLYRFVSRQMPADARGSLGPETYAAIVAYLLRENGHRAGNTVLTPARAARINTKL